MAINLEELQSILLSTGVDKDTHNKILSEAEQVEKEKKELRESGKKKSKYKYTVFVRGDKELAEKVEQAWITKTEESLDDSVIAFKLQEAAGAHNAASKRKKNYITLWSDLFAHLKRKFSKEVGVAITTKEPVRVVVLTESEVGEQPTA